MQESHVYLISPLFILFRELPEQALLPCLPEALRKSYGSGMPLSRQAIKELKAIYRKHYGEDLTDDDAQEIYN